MNWSDPANWAPDGVPGPGDAVTIGEAGTATVVADTSVTVDRLELCNGSNLQIPASSTVTVDEGTSFTGDLLIGDDAYCEIDGAGTIVLNGPQGTFQAVSTAGITWVINGTLAAAGSVAQFSGGVTTPLVINGQLELGNSGDSANSVTAGTITINPAGTVSITTDGWLFDTPAVANGVTNHGTITVDCGAANTAELYNVGTCDGDLVVQSGTMQLAHAPIGTADQRQRHRRRRRNPPVCRRWLEHLRLLRHACRRRAPAHRRRGRLRRARRDDRPRRAGGDVSRRLTLTGASTTTGDLVANANVDGTGSLGVQGSSTVVSPARIDGGATLSLDGPSSITGLTLTDGTQLAINADTMVSGSISDGGSQGGSITVAPGVTVTLDGAIDVDAGAASSSQERS